MATRRWKQLLFGIILLALLPAGGALAQSLDPAIQALAAAGDVNGVAAALARQAVSGGDVTGTMELVAQLNPDIAGAVVNATVRNLYASGESNRAMASVLQELAQGAMSGVSSAIKPDQVTTYAENIATNVRQAVGAVAGGDKQLENALLASARAGVAQSAAGGRGGAAEQILRSDVMVRLQGGLNPNESLRAPNQEPIVVSHSGTGGGSGSQNNGEGNENGNNGQSQQPGPSYQPPAPVVHEPNIENPNIDIPNASPS